MDTHEQNKLLARLGIFPGDVREAHSHSMRNRKEILDSKICGCFDCCGIYPPSEIYEWIDDDESGEGQTALCPKCGTDSVIGDRSGCEISAEFLSKMNDYWFSKKLG